jgi:hypothetical protein
MAFEMQDIALFSFVNVTILIVSKILQRPLIRRLIKKKLGKNAMEAAA